MSPLTDREWDALRRVSKVDLHVHLVGSVRPGTLSDLARHYDVALPTDVDDFYARINSRPTDEEVSAGPWYPLLRAYELICSVLRTEDDFARVVYEALEDGLRDSNVRYQELAFSPSVHMALGVAYHTIARGLVRGVRSAETDLGVRAHLIAAINREDTPRVAVEMMEAVVGYRQDEIAGVGIDFNERHGAPEVFSEAFGLARGAGLHLTAHAGEHVAGGKNIETCLDLLGCERIDHGYYVLDDDRLVERCRRDGVFFNVAFTTSQRQLRPWRRSSVKEMVSRGLLVTINSDDPQLFPTTVSNELAIGATDVGLTFEELCDSIRHGVQASFLDQPAKAELLEEVNRAVNLS